MKTRIWFTLVVLMAPLGARAAAETGDLTWKGIRDTLRAQYHLGEDESNRILGGLKQLGTAEPMRVRGMMWTSGLTFTLGLGTGYWPNITTTFEDATTHKPMTSNCLFDMWYRNGGLAAGLGYRWVLMFLTGRVEASQLAGATFGRGIGLHLPPGLGIDFQVLPGKNVDGNLIVVSPVLGPSVGIRFPKIQFLPAKRCAR